ncbi:hypothetical protein NKJ55_09630 [Mesorhizobium sp. M0106]
MTGSMTGQGDRPQSLTHLVAILDRLQQGPELRKVRVNEKAPHSRLGNYDRLQVWKEHSAVGGQKSVHMILMGVGERQDRDRSRVDLGFRHGLLKTPHCRGPAPSSAVDQNAVNAWTCQREAIDRQAKRPCQRSLRHRIILRVPQKVRRHLDVTVRERPDAPPS